MSRINVYQDLTSETDSDNFMRNSSQIHQQTVDAINGNLEFDQNIRSQTVVVDFPQANVDVAVNHTLNKKNVNYLKGKQSIAMSVFDGSKPSTVSTVYLQSDRAGKATLILY